MNILSTSKKTFWMFILSSLLCCLSATSNSLQLSFPTPPTLESASFIVGQANLGLRPITISTECKNCPSQLNLTTDSSIELASSQNMLAAKDLLTGREYHSVYISYDPSTLNIFSILLK